MPRNGAVLLAEITSAYVSVVCERCDRRGRYATARLLEGHGTGMTMPALLDVLAADCPKRQAAAWVDRCGAHYEL